MVRTKKIKKAQVAMEFLASYGWAILVILVSVGFLAYFGIIDVYRFIPNECLLPAGMTCLEFNVEPARIVLSLQNVLGGDIVVNGINVTREGEGLCSSDELALLKNGQKRIFVVPDCSNGKAGKNFRADLTVRYLKDKLFHSMSGIIIAEITDDLIPMPYIICQNAEDAGLCGGLNIVFGGGYDSMCCEEFEVCC